MPAGGLDIFHRVKVHAGDSSEFMSPHPQHQNPRLCQQQSNGIRAVFVGFGNKCPRSPQRVIQLLNTTQNVPAEVASGNLGIVVRVGRH